MLQQKLRKLLRLRVRQFKVWHPNPHEVLLGRFQKLRKLPGAKFLADVLEGNLRRIRSGLVRRIVATDAVQPLEDGLALVIRVGGRGVFIAHGFRVRAGTLRDFIRRLAVVTKRCGAFHHRNGRLNLQRHQIRRHRLRILLRLWPVQQLRHVNARACGLRIENPLRQPLLISARTNPIERRCVHGQFRHGQREFLRVALRATVLQEQFTPEINQLRLLQFWRDCMRDDAVRNRIHVRPLLRPAHAQSGIAAARATERGAHRIRAFVDLHRLAQRIRCGGFQHHRAVDFQLQRTAQFLRFENVICAQVAVDAALKNSSEFSRRQKRRRRLPALDVEPEVRQHHRVGNHSVRRSELYREAIGVRRPRAHDQKT